MFSNNRSIPTQATCRGVYALVIVTALLSWQVTKANIASPATAAGQISVEEKADNDKPVQVDAAIDETALNIDQAESALTQRHEGQTATLDVSIDKQAMGVAEHLRYTLTVLSDAAANIEFEAVNDNFGDFRVIEYNPFGPIKMEGGQLRWQREYLLAADHAGELNIPALKLSFYPPLQDCLTADACEMTAHGRRDRRRNPKPPEFELSTDAVTIQVSTVLSADVDLTRPRDVQPPIMMAAIAGHRGTPVNLVSVIALLLLASAAVWYFFQRRPESNRPQPIDTGHSPRQTAIEALTRLKKDRLPQQGEHQVHHTRLNHILRRYVAQAFGVTALEKTSDEIVASVNQHATLSRHSEEISQLLNIGDMAKFAHSYPQASSGEEMVDEVVEIIERTSEDTQGATG